MCLCSPLKTNYKVYVEKKLFIFLIGGEQAHTYIFFTNNEKEITKVYQYASIY